ncbi:MAG: cyclase family protein [bacterium]|nr:cyclase family protein [bacterium]
MIDISIPLYEKSPIWPGSTGVHLDWTLRVERGEPSNLTRLDTDIHAGTHVEGGLHSFAKGNAVDQISVETLIGPAVVAHFPDAEYIGRAELEEVGIPDGTKRVLFRTKNSLLWARREESFQEDFVGLTSDGAQYLVECGIFLVGNDYLSVAKFTDGATVHDILLKAGITIIEGLNLHNVASGAYQLVCLPILLPGREAAPARAVLFPFVQ